MHALAISWSSMQGVLSYKDRLEQAYENLYAEKGRHVDILRMLKFWKSRAHELEARLKRCATPAAQQDTRHQPGVDIGVDIQSGLDSMAGAVTDVGEANVHEISSAKGADKDTACETATDFLGATYDDQSMPERMAEAAAPVDGCDDVGDGPRCSEPHVQPCAEVEHAGKRTNDAVVTPCREDDVSAQEPTQEQQQPVLKVGESGAMPRPHVGETVVSTDGPGPVIADVYMGDASAAGEGECTPPASSAANDEDCTHVTADGGILRQRMIPG